MVLETTLERRDTERQRSRAQEGFTHAITEKRHGLSVWMVEEARDEECIARFRGSVCS